MHVNGRRTRSEPLYAVGPSRSTVTKLSGLGGFGYCRRVRGPGNLIASYELGIEPISAIHDPRFNRAQHIPWNVTSVLLEHCDVTLAYLQDSCELRLREIVSATHRGYRIGFCPHAELAVSRFEFGWGINGLRERPA